MSIVRMLKCTLVMRQRDADAVLETVQEAGLLHVAPVAVPEGLLDEAVALDDGSAAHDAETLAQYDALDRRRHALLSVAPAPERLQDHAKPYAEVLAYVDELAAKKKALEETRASLEARIATLRPWGDIDPAHVKALEAAGLDVVFATFTRSDWEARDVKGSSDEPFAWSVSSQDEGQVWALFVGKDLSWLDASQEHLPEERLGDLEAKLREVEHEIGEVQRELSRYAHYEALIAKHMAALSDRVELLRAKQRGVAVGPILALQGYVPAEKSHDLEAAVQRFPLALRIEDPADTDDVPTLLKNNALVRSFETIVRNFSGISYREKDFTWAVALLFVAFGALCLMDAGYGVLLFLTGVWLSVKGTKGLGQVFALTGLGTTVVGLLSGQFFGFVVGQTVFKHLQPPLTLAQVPYHAFLFSLVVGIFVMIFSYGTAIWQRGIKTPATGGLLLVLAAATWVATGLAGEYLLTLLYSWQTPPPALVAEVAAYGKQAATIFGVGALVAFVLFPDPVFGPKARAGNVVWTLYSGGTGLLQDIFSHMRLFGISLSGSIMAFLVNDLGGRLPLPVTILFAVLGHTLIFALSLLSLYVHTNRLIFLEYGSKCIDGGHNEYHPLRRRSLA